MTLLASERSLMIRSKFRSVLQLRLQHRRTREQLAEQGIMPPLKGPAAFFDQRRNLERAKTEDFLKHKIRNRPERTDLVKMNILEGAIASPTQMKQKKARLAENLNEKILHRPGPLELVEKNIIPLNSSVKEAMKVGQIHLPQSSDPSPFEDDSSSSNSSSPEQPGSHQSQSTVGSPQQPTDQPITTSCAPLQSPLGMPQRVELNAAAPEPVTDSNATATSGQSNGQLVPVLPVAPLPTGLPRASEPGKPQRHKKPKEPKVKKLKYHQYIPPDQKAEKCPVAMDAAYSRLLQQQQVFLQLQILNQQQQQSFSFQTIQPGAAGLPPDQIIGFASAVPNQVPCIPLSSMTKSRQRTPIGASTKPELLPANLDDLTVSELRQQLRKRGLPVSGTKPALLERLKPFQIASPKPAPRSLTQLPSAAPGTGAKAEDGVSLVEKEKVIERLTWKLQQEQRQAEDLRVELERRKRRQQQQQQSQHRQAPEASGLLPAPPPPPFSGLVFPPPGLGVETGRAPQASAATTCDPGVAARRPPSPGGPFFFTAGAIDGCGAQRGHSGDGSLSELTVPRSIQPEFPYSPASLHSFFTLEEEDIEAKNESSSEENFEREVFLSASLGSEGRDYGSLEALASSDSGGFQSLEDELTEAIKSAELSQSHSIEDILEEHLMSTEPSPSLDQGLEDSPDYLKERGRLEAQRLSPQALAMDLGGLPQYEAFGVSDLLCGPFSPMCSETPGSCSSPSSSPSPPSSSSCPSPERRGPRPQLSEVTFDPADWIDPLPGNSAAGLGPSSDPTAPSIFSTDFLDSPDLNINRMIDLLVERW